MEMGADKIDVDLDVQLCESMYFYEHLRASEAKKRPAVDFLKTVQQENITRGMRAVIINWLVDVAGRYKLVPETLYLTINYIDRYLSGNPIECGRLTLLGVACMMIASKYEDTHALPVEEFCNITENKYSKDELLQMESSVLSCLKFEMTAPTVICFLRLLLPYAQRDNMAHPMKLYYLASYICESSLPKYKMLRYAPSLVAASAIFLARFVLAPSQKPWNSTLRHYTRYQPSDLQECVKVLRALLCVRREYGFSVIKEKYSQRRYKRVAEITCPASIPLENFDNNISSSSIS